MVADTNCPYKPNVGLTKTDQTK